MGFCDTVLDDFRFIKNKQLLKLVFKLSLQQLKTLNIPKFYIISMFHPSVVIDIEKIHYIYAYIPFFSGDLMDLEGSIVTEIYYPNVKTLDDLLKAFTSKEPQEYHIKKVSSFFYSNKTDTTFCQFMDTYMIIDFASKYVHQAKGDRIFNIKTKIFDENHIYLAYQKTNNFEYANIIDADVGTFNFEFRGRIKIELSNNKKKSSIFKHNFFHSTKRNNKKYERLT